MIYFTAPESDREKLIKLGAKWNAKTNKWSVKNKKDYIKFRDWIKGKVICRELYLLAVEEACPFCKSKTMLVAAACGEYTEDFLPTVYGRHKMSMFYGFEHFPKEIAAWLKKHYPVNYRYFVPYGYKYLSNGCGVCDALFPDPYLFDEEDSPFFVENDDAAKKISVYRLKLKHDIAIRGMIKWEYDFKLFKRNCSFFDITDLDI